LARNAVFKGRFHGVVKMLELQKVKPGVRPRLATGAGNLSKGRSVVLHTWTMEKFKGRLDLMRNMHGDFISEPNFVWNDFIDPWSEYGPDEMTQFQSDWETKLHASQEEIMRLRAANLGSFDDDAISNASEEVPIEPESAARPRGVTEPTSMLQRNRPEGEAEQVSPKLVEQVSPKLSPASVNVKRRIASASKESAYSPSKQSVDTGV